MSFFAHAVQWRRQMYTAPLGLLLFLARSLLLKEKQWVGNYNKGALFFRVGLLIGVGFYSTLGLLFRLNGVTVKIEEILKGNTV